MRLTLESACGCHTGNVRKNNEDNFYYYGNCLDADNQGLKEPLSFEERLKQGCLFAIFDGMGGENFGELASYAAAHQLQQTERAVCKLFVFQKQYLRRLAEQLNVAVLNAKKKMLTERMGSTMASLCFAGKYAYVCNVGDSRAYRFRDGELVQLSMDHVEKRPGHTGIKAPLTQHLGIEPEYLQIEPFIAKEKIERGDCYLLCSDGLTDMLTNFELCDIMRKNRCAEACVNELIRAALERGGRDNITVIVCRLG